MNELISEISAETNPYYSNRIDKDEVERLYQQREQYTISLNDQLENFYDKSKNNRFFKHEVTYFFDAECLSDNELMQYQTKFHKNLKQRNNEDIFQARKLITKQEFISLKSVKAQILQTLHSKSLQNSKAECISYHNRIEFII